MKNKEKLQEVIRAQQHPLLFVTVSGSHLYGFSSPDSDFDLRGVHILPAEQVMGLRALDETIESSGMQDGMELDLVTHDAKKFFQLLLKRNGYVLEQLYSPLILHTTPAHRELKEIARGCITRHQHHHYLGFSNTQRKLFEKESPARIKPLLYVYRVLLTGIYLMRTGEVEANLVKLNREFKLTYLDDLIARKVEGGENEVADGVELEFHRKEFARLTAVLEDAGEKCRFPDKPTCRDALSNLLVRIRMETVAHSC